jgi:hypothetical protein
MKSKYPEIFFEDSGGEGPLYVYFDEPPYGNAIDDETGAGAGFFSVDGNLLAVLFDNVNSNEDLQSLKFPGQALVKIKVKKGKVVGLSGIPSKKSRKVA